MCAACLVPRQVYANVWPTVDVPTATEVEDAKAARARLCLLMRLAFTAVVKQAQAVESKATAAQPCDCFRPGAAADDDDDAAAQRDEFHELVRPARRRVLSLSLSLSSFPPSA